MVLNCKKLFQAGASEVTIGASSTNCHAITVFPHRVRMVICSNRWSEDVATLGMADQQWLTINAVRVEVKRPLWQMDENELIEVTDDDKIMRGQSSATANLPVLVDAEKI